MNSSPNRDVAIFTEAAQLPANERAAYLASACGGDAELRQKVEALLHTFDHVGDFLEASPQKASIEARVESSAGEKAGDRIGRYKLLQQIGEGGWGVVFMAEQDEPVRRKVALKVVKPGMDTKNVIARFEAERQALALMDHPNIAHVFDAGATENGRPYFVMELVRGAKITDYCDQSRMPTADRLELFIQVCNAVQHAHQKGIIHRDIKPSNILVTTSAEGKPLPKVIDFGIAKATTGLRLTDKTMFTAFEMLIGTPAYMSPEQAALTSLDVDTRTDIYSLGVLLYELLTSTTPFDTRELLKAGLDEVRRVIQTKEPVRPSTRLRTMIAADLTMAGRCRQAEPPKLIRSLKGDLDWIVMKGLEKDRTRRYQTATGLAMDIERYLGGEVVLARPASALYKARKLVAQNKLLFSGLAIIFILLAAGFVVTSRLLVAERQARERMQHQVEVSRLEGLAAVQLIQQKYPEAESNYLRSFAIRRQFLNDERPSAAVAIYYVAVLNRESKSDAANAYLAWFLKPDIISNPEYAELFAERATRSAVAGRWQEAEADAVLLLKPEPDNSEHYHLLAPLLVVNQDLAGYHQLCQQIIPRFGGTTNPLIADRMAKDCLILPDSGADLKGVAALADFAITHGRNYSGYPFMECCQALAEYRQKHFDGAVKWARLASADPFPYSQAEAFAILSMGQYKLNQVDAARTDLSNCEQIVQTKLPRLGVQNIGGDWRDWIIAHALLTEAQNLLGVSPGKLDSPHPQTK
jgi:serine/threonine protein kinase